MVECEVCFEVFENEGSQCPKLLPCIHTLCVKCLRKLEKRGEIQCPFDRIFHEVPIGGVEMFPTNQQVLKQIVAEKNKKTPPFAGASHHVDCRTGNCELHGKTLIIDDEIDGKFCETCLTIAHSVESQRKSGSEKYSEIQHERERLRNNTRNSATGREDEARVRRDFSRMHIGQTPQICTLHGKPSISVIYNAADGTEKRFCESCLNLNSSFMDERDSPSGEQTGERIDDQLAQRLGNNTLTRTYSRDRRNQVGVFGTVRRLHTGLPIYQQGQITISATSTENEAGICPLHGKPLIIYNEADGRLCETCLNLESSIMDEREPRSREQTRQGSSGQQLQSSRNNAPARNRTTAGENEAARCSLHGKPLIRISYNLIDGTVQRLCETCLNPGSPTLSQQEPRSREDTGQDSRVCALHGKPLIIYNETDGRFCETCLNLDSSIMSQRESTSEEQTGHGSSDQQSQSSQASSSNQPQICELHGIPLTRFTYNVISGTHESFCEACLNLDFDNISASGFRLPSSQEPPRNSNRAEICEQHGQPLTQFSYDVGHGEQRRFCKACFNPGSHNISVPDVVSPDRSVTASSISTLQ